MSQVLIEPVPGVKIAPLDLALLWLGLRGMGVSRPDLDGKYVSLRSATRRAVGLSTFAGLLAYYGVQIGVTDEA